MGYYFRFEIPTNTDGSRVSYSPNWHGTMPKCPKNVTVLLYNDKEGYGIAQTKDTFVPPEVAKITKSEADKILAGAQDEEGVFFGDKLVHRWDEVEEVVDELPSDIDARFSVSPDLIRTDNSFELPTEEVSLG